MGDYTESDELFRRVARSELYAQFCTAFEAATGMTLQIHDADMKMDPSASGKANPFCKTINKSNRCPDCVTAANCVIAEASHSPKSFDCFAGLTESAVPILAGQIPIAYLTTGQVFTEDAPPVKWEVIVERLASSGFGEAEIADLEEKWKATKRLNPDQYEGMITLLAVFCGQLSDLAGKLILQQQSSDPEVVVKARQYVSAHLADRIDLADVSRHVGMSQYHFCKVFKQASGLTFKQYLTRRRVEWAKCRLRKPGARVTEVAYDVGFGSLSQFNRSFQQVLGSSPTEWRTKELQKMA